MLIPFLLANPKVLFSFFIFLGNTSTISLVPTNIELGEQSRKMLNKLIPLIQLCKEQPGKNSANNTTIKPSHKKSFSISHVQPSILLSKKSIPVQEVSKSAIKTKGTIQYNLQAETLDCRKSKPENVPAAPAPCIRHHARTKSEIVTNSKVSPMKNIKVENNSQANLNKKILRDSSTTVVNSQKKINKYTSVVTTPPSPEKSMIRPNIQENNKPQQIRPETSKGKSQVPKHKRSNSDSAMVAKNLQMAKPQEPIKSMNYKNIGPANMGNNQRRPGSSTGHFAQQNKKSVAQQNMGLRKPHHEKSVSTQFMLNSFGKFVMPSEDFKGKSLLEEFRKGGCVIKNHIKTPSTNVTTFVKKAQITAINTEKENELEKSLAQRRASGTRPSKTPSKVTAVAPPSHSVLHSPKHNVTAVCQPKEICEIKCQNNEKARTAIKEKPKVVPYISSKTPAKNTIVPLSTENLNKFGHQKDNNLLIENIVNYFKEHNDAPATTTEFYRIGRLLGKGAFGKVNLGMHKLTGKMVAIKSINKECLTDENSKKKVMQEFSILKLMKHQSVIRLYETFESKKHILFIIELCAGGDLLNYVRKRRRLKEITAKYVFKQIIDGLNYIHSKGILHRDIKLDNILLNANGDIKICDFGVSKVEKKGEKMFEQCGTPAYIAPEILRDKGYEGFSVDIWSAGVALYAILYGTVPFKGSDMKALQKQILKGQYTLKDDISNEARDLLKKMLDIDPRKRITGQEILLHPWLQSSALDPKINLFTEQEKDSIRKEYSYVHKNNGTETGTLFTEQNIDSTQNDLTKNISTKSVILAPFNSTQSGFSTGEVPIIEKGRAIKFSAKCRDVDRQYEKNNNGEVDNGVYNKFVETNNSKEKSFGNESGSSLEQSFEDGKEKIERQYTDLLEDNEGYTKTESTQAQSTVAKYNIYEHEKDDKIDETIIKQIEAYGYSKKYMNQCLSENKMNYATAAYYLLLNNV